jgi:uncharacterized protein
MLTSQCGSEGNKTEAWGAVIAGLLILLLPAVAHGSSPSFDCKQVTSWVEKAICSDDELAALDVELDASYRRSIQLLSAPRVDAVDHAAETELREARVTSIRRQRQWLAARVTCRAWLTSVISASELSCLRQVYLSRIDMLDRTSGIIKSSPVDAPKGSARDQSGKLVVRIPGSWPGSYGLNADGSVSFNAFALDGNHYVLHVVAATGSDRIYGLFRSSVKPVAANGSYVIGAIGNRFFVFDRSTGKLLTKRVTGLYAPDLPDMAWIEGNLLAVVSSSGALYSNTSTVTFLSLPDLATVEKRALPLFGKVLPWRNGYVGLGYGSSDMPGGRHPVVVIFQGHDFSVVKQAPVSDSVVRNNEFCSLVLNTAPIISGDFLIYGADCGGIHVFDLARMTEVARRSPIADTTYLQFVVRGDRLLAVSSASGEGIATELQIPSLKLLGSSGFPIDSNFSIEVSRGNTFVFDESVSIGDDNPPVVIYPDSAGLFPSTSLAQSLLETLHEARGVWSSTGDIYQAIATVEQAGSVPGPDDLRSLPPNVQNGLAWYAGLLVSTEKGASKGAAMLRSIYASSPQDSAVSTLMSAAIPWEAARAGSNELAGNSPVPRGISLTTGPLREAIASSAKYVIASRWCGDGCAAGIGVYDAGDLRNLAYVPIVVSDPQIQEYIGSVAISGHIAYATIVRRFAEKGPNLVAIDLGHDRIVAKSSAGPYSQLRAISGSIVGCTGSFGSDDGTCQQIDSSSLLPKQIMAGLATPNPDMPDAVLDQLVRQGVGHYAQRTLAAAAKRLLIAQFGQFTTLEIVDGSSGTSTAVSGKFGLTGGFGVSSPNGDYAYIVDTRANSAPADERVTRIDMKTGAAVDLADGPIMPWSLMAIGPLLAFVNGDTIQVRDARDGRFLCTWLLPSGLPIAETPRVVGTYVDPAGRFFAIIRTPSFGGSRSVMFETRSFVSQSVACGRQSAVAEDGFTRALRSVAP